MKSFFLACYLLLITGYTIAQTHEQGPIKWMTIQEAFKLQQSKPKKIFIDMYTHWCGWCKKMDASTFQDSAFASYMMAHFYPVKMDAETRDTILYQGKPYAYKPDYKVNELAAMLLSGQMSYPTSVFLDENENVISPVPGFMTAEQMLPILRFFGEDIFKTKTWEDYVKDLQQAK
jgi:thioredoxin-related protein